MPTVIKKWVGTSWEMWLGAAVTWLAFLDPTTIADYIAILPDTWEPMVYRILAGLTGLSVLYLRYFKTDSKLVMSKADATPKAQVEEARAIAAVPEQPSATDIAKAKEILKKVAETNPKA